MIDKLLIGAGLVLAAYGFIGLIGTWLVPAIGSSRVYGSNMLTGRMEPTRVNRTIMSLWYLFFGSCVASLFSGHRTLSRVLLSAFLLCVVTAMVKRYRHGR